jgi:hypothetical protein
MVTTAAILLPDKMETNVTVSDLCLILGVLIAFATLVVKIVEVRNR